jgi:hypothetical protein
MLPDSPTPRLAMTRLFTRLDAVRRLPHSGLVIAARMQGRDDGRRLLRQREMVSLATQSIQVVYIVSLAGALRERAGCQPCRYLVQIRVRPAACRAR